MDVADRTVLVTGGGRGIGRAIALGLAQRGAHLVLVGRDEAALDAACRELDAVRGASSAAAIAVSCDLSDARAVDDLAARCRRERPNLAGLVNNAAVQHELDLLSGDPHGNVQLAREEIAVDLGAAVTLSVALLPLLKAQPAAFLCNVTTGLAFAPKEKAPVYCAAKAGLSAFGVALRYQCERSAPHVRVCEAIMPLVDTDMTRGRGRGKISAEAAAAAVLRAIERDHAEAWVGKAKLLRVLRRVAPGLPERMLRGDGFASGS